MDALIMVLLALGAPVLVVLTWKFPTGMDPEPAGVTLSPHPSFLPSMFALLSILSWYWVLDELGVIEETGLIGEALTLVLFVMMVLSLIATVHGLGAGFLYPAIPFLVPPTAREKARKEREMRRRRRMKKQQES